MSILCRVGSAVRKYQDAIAVVIVLASTLHFYRCIYFTDWYVDELPAIVRNQLVTGHMPFSSIFDHDFWGNHLWEIERATHKSFRPVTIIIWRFIAYWTRAELDDYVAAFSLRLFSCALHSVTSLAVLALIRRKPFNCAIVPATLAAVLFGLHPVHVENIVYVVGSADSLSTLLSILAVMAVDRSVAVALVFGLLSAFSKESGFTVFPYLMLHVFLTNYGAAARSYVWKILTVFSTLISFVLFRLWLVGGAPINFAYVDVPIIYVDSMWSRFLTYFLYHSVYLRLLLLPWHQSWDYSFDAVPTIQSISDYRNLAGLATYTCIAAVCYVCAKRGKPIILFSAFCLLAFPFVPTSSLFLAVGTVVGERLLYPVTVGYVLLLAITASVVKKTWKKSLTFSTLVVLCAAYGKLSSDRLMVWQSKFVLYKVDADAWPRSAKTLHQWGATLLGAGQLDEAEILLRQSLRVFDDNALTDYLIAQIYMEKGDYNTAWSIHAKVADGHGIGFTDFSRFMFLVDAGWTLIALNHYEPPAEAMIKEGLEIFSFVPHALNALAMISAKRGAYEESGDHLVKAIDIDPSIPHLWNNAACVAYFAGDVTTAVNFLKKAIEVDLHQMTVARRNLEIVLANADRGTNTEMPEMQIFFQRMR
jgi:Flp pilus assembly protein TadD